MKTILSGNLSETQPLPVRLYAGSASSKFEEKEEGDYSHFCLDFVSQFWQVWTSTVNGTECRNYISDQIAYLCSSCLTTCFRNSEHVVSFYLLVGL